MPIYEYRCNDCGAKVSLFLRSFSQKAEPICHNCHGSQLTRLISRAVIIKSTSQRLQDMDLKRELSGLDPRDHSSVERWARRAGKEYDELLGTDFAEQARQITGARRPYELYDPAGNFALMAQRKLEESLEATRPKTWREQISEEIINYDYSGDAKTE